MLHRVAHEYAAETPMLAEVTMTNAGVQHDGRLRRSIAGIRYRAGQADGQTRQYSGHFVGTLKRFMLNPPVPVSVEPPPVSNVSADRVRIVFYNDELMRHAMQNFVRGTSGLKIVMDGTYKTNIQRLVLVGAGFVFVVNENDKVHNRFIPLSCAGGQRGH